MHLALSFVLGLVGTVSAMRLRSESAEMPPLEILRAVTANGTECWAGRTALARMSTENSPILLPWPEILSLR